MEMPTWKVWLPNDGKLASIFPSYLLRALRVDEAKAEFTGDLTQANLLIGGRILLRIPEHFQGTVLGSGLERVAVRTLPFVKFHHVLGEKTAECCILKGKSSGVPGDPLLLAEWVYMRLSAANLPLKPLKSAKALLWLQSEAESVLLTPLQKAAPEWHIQVGAGALGFMESIILIATSSYVLSTDPDVLAIALSFNMPTCPITFASGDIFMVRDLYSALGKVLPTVKRFKTSTKPAETATWVQTRPFGDLKLVKQQLQHQFETFFGGPKLSLAGPTKPAKLRARSSSRSKTLSATQPIIPLKRQTPLLSPVSSYSASSFSSLSSASFPSFVSPVPSLVLPPISPISPFQASPASPASPPPLPQLKPLWVTPAPALASPLPSHRSQASSANIRSRGKSIGSRSLFSHKTP